jgi:hypothetical protein
MKITKSNIYKQNKTYKIKINIPSLFRFVSLKPSLNNVDKMSIKDICLKDMVSDTKHKGIISYDNCRI